MEDALRLRTLRLLTDYLEYCARRPGAAPQPPSTPEAAVLRALAAHIRQRYQFTWSRYRGYPGNRVELVASAVQDLHRICDALSWGHVVVLVTFAGILLERPPSDDTRRLEEWDASVGRDCRSLATLLCDWLAGQQRAWMEARGGWVSGAGPRGAGIPDARTRLAAAGT